MSSRTVMIIAPSAHTLGGVQTWLDYLMPGLRRLGWHVTLGLVSGRYHDVSAYLASHPYDNAISIENRTGSVEGRIDAIAKAISMVRPNIVMVVNIIDTYAAVRRLKTKHDGFPKVVATLHGIQSDFVYDTASYSDVSDGVICTNRLLQELVREYSGIEHNRVLYAPYGVKIPCVPKPRDSNQDLITIAYVGRLERLQKKFHNVIDILSLALKNSLKVKLIVAGDGPEMDWFITEIKSRGLSNHVDVLGQLDQNQISSDVYEVSDALLITSSWETGPIVAWEAMAHGKVVISSKFIGSGKEGALVEGYNCLMFDNGDIGSAVECITQLGDKNYSEKLVKNALSVVGKRYSLEQSIGAWSEQLSTVMRQAPRSNPGSKFDCPNSRGRLDRVFGARVGERVRKLLRRQFVHQEAGGEWPHSYAGIQDGDVDFLAMAGNMDRH